MKKLTAFILAAVMIFALAACGGKDSPAVLTYGETVITEAMYNYYVSTYKGRYIQSYDDISDSEDFWKSEINGKTGEEIMRELIYGNVAQNLVAAEEFRRAGLSLSADQKTAVDEYIESMTEELAGGSRKTLNGYLSEFGVNVDMLREMLLMEKMAYTYYEYLYGEGGKEAVTDSDRDTYYKENFVRFQQIYINDKVVYETDEDGRFKQDENGDYVTREFTPEERADIDARIAAVKSGLESGEDFDALRKKYSDVTDFEDGYYFSAATSTNYITSIVSAAFALDEGEWTLVSAAADQGTFFIKRLPLEDGAYKDEDNSEFFSSMDEDLTTEKYGEKLEALYGDIVKNEEFLGAVSVKDAPANYWYY
ncbi:MAG: hypothetical protein IJ386_06205 [Clostridia bacterium]|nr:hypothetical protein [Clostridia bacterium]